MGTKLENELLAANALRKVFEKTGADRKQAIILAQASLRHMKKQAQGGSGIGTDILGGMALGGLGGLGYEYLSQPGEGEDPKTWKDYLRSGMIGAGVGGAVGAAADTLAGDNGAAARKKEFEEGNQAMRQARVAPGGMSDTLLGVPGNVVAGGALMQKLRSIFGGTPLAGRAGTVAGVAKTTGGRALLALPYLEGLGRRFTMAPEDMKLYQKNVLSANEGTSNWNSLWSGDPVNTGIFQGKVWRDLLPGWFRS